jgi:hypothetical protein
VDLQVQTIDFRKVQMLVDPEENPTFEYVLELASAGFKSRCSCPDSFETRNLSVVGLVILHDLIVSLAERSL